MKKTYTKPMVYAESFAMLEHIAACTIGQGYSATLRDTAGDNACAYTDNGLTVFPNEGVCGGSYNERQYGSWDAYMAAVYGANTTCYNAFQTGLAFNS